jgi:hypothetical protein
MTGLGTLFYEVGIQGLILAVVIELAYILGILTAWKLGLPLADMKSPLLRIPLRLSQPPRKPWSFRHGVTRVWNFLHTRTARSR